MSAAKEKILLVDDDVAFTQVLQRALEKRGFDTVVAHTEVQALELCTHTTFDKAVIDLKLENGSGLQIIAPLKQQQPQIRIVMLTGYSSISTAVDAIKLGATNYLCKPADADEILAAFEKTGGSAETAIAPNPPSVERLEWEHIQKVLQEHNGNISATARALGMHRRTLQRKLQKRPVRQ